MQWSTSMSPSIYQSVLTLWVHTKKQSIYLHFPYNRGKIFSISWYKHQGLFQRNRCLDSTWKLDWFSREQGKKYFDSLLWKKKKKKKNRKIKQINPKLIWTDIARTKPEVCEMHCSWVLPSTPSLFYFDWANTLLRLMIWQQWYSYLPWKVETRYASSWTPPAYQVS